MTAIWCACAIVVPMILMAWVPGHGPALVKQIALAAWGTGATLFFERRFYSSDIRSAWSFVGLKRTPLFGSAVAALVTIPMWLLLPISAQMNGIEISMRPDWPAIVLGVVLVNGIAEEVIHRGFVFHRLRRTLSFAPAASIAAAVFAAQHLYLVLSIGWIAGLASVVLALLVTFPLVYAFESNGNSIGASAIIHTGSNAPMLIFVSRDGALTSLLVPYMSIILLSAYGLFLLPHARQTNSGE